MKFLCSILLLLMIVSCDSNPSPIAANDSAYKTEVPRTPVIDAENYVGILPCADCEGIDVTLQLKKDSGYIMNSVYKGSKVDSSNNHIVDNGTWSMDKDTLILSTTGTVTKYIKSGSTLKQLDVDGKVMTGPLPDDFILYRK